MNREGKKKAFTLVELMLAMAFVSMLLVAVAMTVIQMANTYNRGLTLKDVNQAGNDIANELQRYISSVEDFELAGPNSRYVVNKADGKVVGGRLCVGQYSYVWNMGQAIYDKRTGRNQYVNPSDGELRFIKVSDSDASYCRESSKVVEKSDAIELLGKGDHDLAIHDFSILTQDSAGDSLTGQRLYSISFLLGTNNNPALDYSDNNIPKCWPLPDPRADPAYCYLNRFDIVARAGNNAI